MQKIQRSKEEFSSILSTVMRMSRSYGRIGLLESEDIAQEVMMKVLRKTDGKVANSRWLYRLVHSSAMDAGRKAVREKRFLSRDLLEEELQLVSENADKIGYAVNFGNSRDYGAAQDLELDMESALKDVEQKLSPAMLQTLLLHCEGYPYEEIASMTGAKIGTVRSRLHHARKRMRVLLGEVA